MWERWKEGATLHQIAKLFDRAHGLLRGTLAASGGIRPAERHRAELALILAEREEISRAMVAGRSIRTIAARASSCWLSALVSEPISHRQIESMMTTIATNRAA